MMNEATDVRHVAVVFRLCLNAEKMFPRPGNRSFTSPGVHWRQSRDILTNTIGHRPVPYEVSGGIHHW
jgi:hypothetical protein